MNAPHDSKKRRRAIRNSEFFRNLPTWGPSRSDRVTPLSRHHHTFHALRSGYPSSKTNTATAMSHFTLFHGGTPPTPHYPQDTHRTRDGSELTLTFFRHASLSLAFGGKYIYTDPVSDYADYARLPKADLVLIGHSHYDHFDRAAVDTLTDRHSLVVCDKTTSEAFDGDCLVMTPGMSASPRPYLQIEAVAAYNTTPGHLDFHPRARQDCGYILTLGGTRIYLAGDTEPTPEMLALPHIDVAFLPVNQPYTMTVDQAAEAVRTLRPQIFYPYHYGQVDEKTDLERLCRLLDGVTDVRIRPLD